MRGVDDHDVHAASMSAIARRSVSPTLVAAATRRRPRRPCRRWDIAGLLDVFHRDEADAAIGVVDDEDLLDAVLVQKPLGFLGADAFAHGDKIVLRHQLAHGLSRIHGEAHVAVGEDADEPAGALPGALDDGNPGDPMALHQRERVGERRVGRDGHRIDDRAALELLHPADLLGLFLDARGCGE